MKFAIILVIIIGFSLIFMTCNKDNPTDGSQNQNNENSSSSPYSVVTYDSTKACNGTTLFSDFSDPENLKAVEVDMKGNVVWEYRIPKSMAPGNTVGLDVELLNNGNMLLVISQSGLYEITRDSTVVWQQQDADCSHDGDRLSNNNTIYIFGNEDTKDDACVKEVNFQKQCFDRWCYDR